MWGARVLVVEGAGGQPLMGRKLYDGVVRLRLSNLLLCLGRVLAAVLAWDVGAQVAFLLVRLAACGAAGRPAAGLLLAGRGLWPVRLAGGGPGLLLAVLPSPIPAWGVPLVGGLAPDGGRVGGGRSRP